MQHDKQSVSLFNGQTGDLIKNLKDEDQHIWLPYAQRDCEVFSPDDGLLVLEAREPHFGNVSLREINMDFSGQSLHPQSLRVFEASTGELTAEILQRGRQVNLVGFSHGGDTLWALVDHHELHARRFKTDRTVVRAQLSGNVGFLPRVTDKRLAFSPNGKLLAVAEGKEKLRLLDPLTGVELYTIHLDNAKIANFTFGAHGKQLVISSDDGTIQTFKTSTGRPLKRFHDHPEGTLVDIMEISGDGATVASASAEDTPGPVVVRNLSSQSRGIHLQPNAMSDEIKAISFSPRGDRLAFITLDGEVCVWQIRTASSIEKMSDADPGLPFRGIAVAFANGGEAVVGATAFGKLRKWQSETGEVLADFDLRLENADYGLDAAVFTPEGDWLVVAEESVVQIVEVATGQRKVLGDKGEWALPPIVVSPSGRLVATNCPDGAVRLWRVRDGERVSILWRHPSSIVGIAFSIDEQLLASVDSEGNTLIWDIQASLLSGKTLTAWLCRNIGGNVAALYGTDFENMLLRDVIQHVDGNNCDLVQHILSRWPELRDLAVPGKIAPGRRT
ncbi:MAG: WD40 repeat domain-containing protein [Candidatus Sulfotelmatobacter sp.]